MADRNVNIRINYVVNTADVIRAQAASNAAQRATDNLRKSVQDYGKTTDQVNRQVQQSNAQTSKSFGELENAIGLVISAAAVQRAVELTLTMAKLSGQVEGVTRAFERLPNSTLLLKQLRDATHGTVNDVELMQKALTAQNFRIPLQNLGTLLEFAATKAQQTGQEVNHLVDYIVSGIGYRSIKRLDDLGFTANRMKEALGGVSLQAASMGQVMDAVTKLMNEDLQKTGGYAETTETKVKNIERAWHDLGVEISKQGTSGGALDFMRKSIDALTTFAKAGFSGNYIPGVVASEFTTKQAEDQAAAFQKSNSALKEQDRLLNTDKKIFELGSTIKLYKEELSTNQQRVATINEEIKSLEEKNKSLIGLQKLSTEEAKQIRQRKDELKSIDASNSALIANKAIVAEVIRMLVDYRETLKSVDDTQNGLAQGQRSLPNNIAFMSPDTTATKKSKTTSLLDRNQLVDVQKQLQDAIDSLPPINAKITPYVPMDEWEKIKESFAANWKDIAIQGIQDTANIINAGIQAEASEYDARLNMLQSFYDNEIAMAGDNERKKKELAIERDRLERKLRKEAFDADKKAKELQTIINGAASIVQAWVSPGYPGAIPLTVFLAANTAAQLTEISEQQFTGYKDGVLNLKGPGTEKSDSIPAMLSRGESVMTAEETRNSFGILKEIRTGKLNDRILKQMVSNGGSRAVLDDSRIVSAIQNQPKPASIVKQAGHIYEVYTDRQGNKRYIRSKSI